MSRFLDRIPAETESFSFRSQEVHVLDAFESDADPGRVLLSSIHCVAVETRIEARLAAQRLLEEVLDGYYLRAVAVVVLERHGTVVDVVLAYDVALMRNVEQLFELLGRTFCPNCHAEWNAGDVDCYRCNDDDPGAFPIVTSPDEAGRALADRGGSEAA